jgi:hypothetical protein
MEKCVSFHTPLSTSTSLSRGLMLVIVMPFFFTPKGLHPIAQGCRVLTATLGKPTSRILLPSPSVLRGRGVGGFQG